MLKKIASTTLFKLIVAVIIGLLLGPYATDGIMNIVVTLKHLLGQMIMFFVPLIILAFIASSIAKMGSIASRLVGVSLTLAYSSSVGAAFMAMGLGYLIIPQLSIGSVSEVVNHVPPLIFELNIPPVMGVMTALTLSIMVGLAAVWSNSVAIVNLLDEFQKMILLLIKRVLIPILPIFIASNFAILSYEGALTNQLPIFINVMAIVLLAHLGWLAILYGVAAIFTRDNPWEVLRHYAPPYFTAVGTMSSAATLPVSLGIVISILGFDEAATALLLTIFALQDSFGTACNVVGDGALTMIVNKFDKSEF